jgi:tetratricopeptide (TPR) repeat protein
MRDQERRTASKPLVSIGIRGILERPATLRNALSGQGRHGRAGRVVRHFHRLMERRKKMHRGRILIALGVASLMSQSAQAAVTVLGNGLAHTCYEAAEFGGNPTDGITACTQALEQMALPVRDRAATLVNRGILYSRLEEPQTAIADYDKGIEMEPNLGEAYVDRGAALIVLTRYDEAVQDIDKGIALGSNRLQIAYYDRGLAEEALGNVREAYESYKKATEIEPGFALASSQLARFKVVRHHNDGA